MASVSLVIIQDMEVLEKLHNPANISSIKVLVETLTQRRINDYTLEIPRLVTGQVDEVNLSLAWLLEENHNGTLKKD